MMLRKLNIRRFLKLFAITVLAGALILGYAFYSISTGDAFTEFQNWCMRSLSVEATVGKFQKAELMPFASAFEKDKGDTGSAGFTARIVGSRTVVIAEVKMKRNGDIWEVEQISISGKLLDVVGVSK